METERRPIAPPHHSILTRYQHAQIGAPIASYPLMGIFRGLAPFALIVFSSPSHAATGLFYSKILPGSGATVAAMATDSAGNVYLTGSTVQYFTTTPGVVQPNFGGGSCNYGGSPFMPPTSFSCPDAFVMKLDVNGNVVFATFLGGAGWDQGTSIGVDGAGNIYVAGITNGYRFPNPPANSPFKGPAATFIAKLNPSGTELVHLNFLPGTGLLPFAAPFSSNVPDLSNTIAIAVDSTGNVYFTAKGTPGFPVTSNPLQTKGPLVAGKLDPTGTQLIYGTYFGGIGNSFPSVGGIAIDASGNAYVAGGTNAPDFPVTAGALQTTLPPNVSNAFVVKLNSSGTGLIYGTYLGANSLSRATQIRVDSSGNAYVLGALNSAGFPLTPGVYLTNYTGGNGFLAKLDPNGAALVYSTLLFTNGLPPSIFDIDAAGNAYFSGDGGVLGFHVSADAFQSCPGGGGDTVVAELTADGKFAAATFLGGSSFENAFAIGIAQDGAVLLAGRTNSSDFPVTQGSLAPPGLFISKLRITDPSNTAVPCSGLAIQNGASFLDGPVAPGELITVRGFRFGPENGVGMQLDSSGNVSNQLAGVRVLFDDIPAPLLYAQAQQINAQVPWEVAGQSNTQIRVEYNGVSMASMRVPVAQSAPAFFRANYYSQQGAILNEDGTVNSASNPARRGSVVAIFGTGGGVTDPSSVTGGFTPLAPLAFLTLPVSVTVGISKAEVVFKGAAPTLVSGVMQINFRIPDFASPGAAQSVSVKIGDTASDPQALVTIAIQ
jgi:uncharacterized protein (TIGR03437 family)